MKVCMSLGHFDRAIEIGKEVIAANPLMTERFTTNKTKPNTNLMHDLHSVEAKMDMSNTEGILYVVSYPEVEGRDRINTMRNATPYWANGSIKTPDGKTGMSIVPANEAKGTELDNDANVGVVSELAVRPIIISMTYGRKRRKTTCVVYITAIAGRVYSTYTIMLRLLKEQNGMVNIR